MSLFNLITESVLNEIRAEDAYSRFYSSMPRETFNAITGGQENIDKFIQFFLNCVRDNKSTPEEAINAISAYNRADQLVKNKIKNKITSGEYEDVDDVISDVKYLSSGGAVLSRKKFAKEGYIKLGENERWMCTCTTNYCANNHYYGNSHWCTASDRMGRYDGYQYFKSYSVGPSCALIQYKWKGKVIEGGRYYSNDSFDPHEGFIGDEITQQFSMFQAQVDYDGDINQLCDFLDRSLYGSDLKKYVGEDLYGIIKDREKIEFCINRTKEQSEVEEPYQDAIYESLKKKKERRERELIEKKERLQAQCDQENTRKLEFIKQQWKEFCEKLAQGDTDIARKMWVRDIIKGGNDLDEESLKETHYCRFSRRMSIDSSHSIVCVMVVMGNKKVVKRTYLSNGLEDVEIGEDFRTNLLLDVGMAVILGHSNGNVNIVNKFGPYDEKAYVYCINHYGNDYDSANRFFEVATDGFSTHICYDSKTNTSFDLKFDVTVFRIDKNKFAFIDENEDNSFNNFFIYNGDTQQIEPTEDGTQCYKMYYTTGIGFVNKKWKYQLIFCPGYEMYGKKMPCMDKVEELDHIDGDDDKFYTSFDRDSAPVNMYSKSQEDFVFGIFGTDVWFEDGEYMLRYRVKNKLRKTPNTRRTTLMRMVLKKGGSYVKFVDDGNREEIPCDKYGRTEKDIIGDKNLKDWQAAGGHSPEAKAQMDAMWADKDAKDNDGSEAMAAWNDDDVRRDLGIPDTFKVNVLGNDPRYTSPQMKAAMEDHRWKGIMGIKDPEGFLGHMGGYKTPPVQRPNPFYRIGTNGKPLDQPWYDEDEVPAKFAEYSDEINEAVNKIKSLFDRMGLLD